MANFVNSENNEYFKVAKQALLQAGHFLKINFNKEHPSRAKSFREIGIKEDIEAEKIILDLILKNFPHHKIYSEEKGYLGNKKSEFLWIVDPLDGTTNYSLNMPLFATQLALARVDKLIFSIIWAPMLDSMLWAIKNEGAYLNKKRIYVSINKKIKKSIVCVDKGTEDKHIKWYGKILPALMGKPRTFRAYGSCAIIFPLLAQGKIDGILIYGSKLYDSAPGILAIQESGGKTTDETGRSWTFNSEYLVASNGKIHNQLIKILKKTCENKHNF